MADPSGDFRAAVVASDVADVVLNAHVAGIVRTIDDLRSSCAKPMNAAIALHTILYHLLGGAERMLPAPPLNVTSEETKRFNPGWAVAHVHALTRALVSDKRFKESVKARGHVVYAASEESAALSSDNPPPCRRQEVYIFLDILGSS